MSGSKIPTLYELAGGTPAFEQLIQRFYEKVVEDPLLKPLFGQMASHHPQYVAWFLCEVFGGPKTYSEKRGGHVTMLRQHLDKHITEAQRQRWVALLLETADEMGLPDDPEFRSAFVGYIEWGTRLAVINSQGGVEADPNDPMPSWGWGETGGPYQPDD